MNYENVITPWGKSQGGYKWMEGITQYHTAGHGGIRVIKKLNDRIPLALRYDNGWYEEDCAASIVMYFFFDEIYAYCLAHGEEFLTHISKSGIVPFFREYGKEFHLASIKQWHTAEYEVYSGESMLQFKLDNKMHFQDAETLKAEYLAKVQAVKDEMNKAPLQPLEIGKRIAFNESLNYGGSMVSGGVIIPYKRKGKAFRTNSGLLCKFPNKETLKRIGYTIQ